jgi:hypothetical protein
MSKYRMVGPTILLVLLLAVVIRHVRVVIFEDDLRRSILSDQYLLDGKPQWRLFQSGLPGPIVARTFVGATRYSDLGYTVFDLIGFACCRRSSWRHPSRWPIPMSWHMPL